MNLYRATSIMAPAHVPAERRTAFGDDLEWLAAWQFRSAEQAGLSAAGRTEDMRAVVAARLARGEMVVWIIGGRAVSSAAFLPSTPARDAGASMPYPRSRRSAAGVTHPPALPPSANGCRIAAGAICLIFADRDNPITTRIYQRLGYQKLATFSQMAFEDDG